MGREITEDSLFDGELICHQHRNGYRFSIDPVILAHFVRPKSGTSILDMGTGCGIISILLAYRFKKDIQKITALEIQEELYLLAQKNVFINRYSEVIDTLHGDLTRILDYCQPESFDYVYCNPPFFKKEQGRKNSDQEALYARHQLLTTLQDIARASRQVLKNKGSLNLIYPAKDIIELVTTLSDNRLEIKRMQFVYGYPESPCSNLVVVEAVKNGGAECKVLTPLYVYDQKNGEYSQQLQKFYQSNF